jgi:hypothetical protein
MGMNGTAIDSAFQQLMLELAGCGFSPLGTCSTQGSGFIGRALSADGTTWADATAPRSNLRSSLRHLLKKGGLRGTGWSAQFTITFNTLFSDGSSLITTGAGAPADLALRHMQRLEARLLQRHPVKALIHIDAGEVAGAAQRLLEHKAPPSGRPLNVTQLCHLGIPEHLAELIGGVYITAEPAPQTLP